MVVGAPVAILAYSRRARDFVKKNRQGFYNMFIGTMACLLCLRNIKYQYRISALQKKVDEKDREIQYLYDYLCSGSNNEWIRKQIQTSEKEAIHYLFQSLFKTAQEEAKFQNQPGNTSDSDIVGDGPANKHEVDLEKVVQDAEKDSKKAFPETSEQNKSSNGKDGLQKYKGWL